MKWTQSECESRIRKACLSDPVLGMPPIRKEIKKAFKNNVLADSEFDEHREVIIKEVTNSKTMIGLYEKGLDKEASRTNMEQTYKIHLLNTLLREEEILEIFLCEEFSEAFPRLDMTSVPLAKIDHIPRVMRVWLSSDVIQKGEKSDFKNEKAFSTDSTFGKTADSVVVVKSDEKIIVYTNWSVALENPGKISMCDQVTIPLTGTTIGELINKSEINTVTQFGVRVAINALLYYSSTDNDVLERINPDYNRQSKKMQRLTGKSKKKAKEKLSSMSQGKHYVFGLNVMRLQRRREKRSGTSSGDGSGNTIIHDVRGHPRWQACGKGLCDHKLIWIDGHERGSIKAKKAYIAVT